MSTANYNHIINQYSDDQNNLNNHHSDGEHRDDFSHMSDQMMFSPTSFDFLNNFSLSDASPATSQHSPVPKKSGSKTVPCTPSLGFGSMMETLPEGAAASFMNFMPEFLAPPGPQPRPRKQSKGVRRNNSFSEGSRNARHQPITPPFTPVHPPVSMGMPMDTSISSQLFGGGKSLLFNSAADSDNAFLYKSVMPRPSPTTDSDSDGDSLMPPLAVFKAAAMHTKRGAEAVLTEQQLHRLFQDGANAHASPTRCKRDIAILCLILDTHLSSGTIIQLTFACVQSLVEGVLAQQLDGHDATYDGHVINVLQVPGQQSPSRHRLHPFTAWALHQWIRELVETYRWDAAPDQPLFVNSQPVLSPVTGQRELRKLSLKRDAISKVFQSIKARSGVAVPKTTTAASSLAPLDSSYLELELMMTIQQQQQQQGQDDLPNQEQRSSDTPAQTFLAQQQQQPMAVPVAL